MAKAIAKPAIGAEQKQKNKKTTKDTNKTALDALFVPPSLHRLAACILLCADGRHCSCF